jgi:hypothetical protein
MLLRALLARVLTLVQGYPPQLMVQHPLPLPVPEPTVGFVFPWLVRDGLSARLQGQIRLQLGGVALGARPGGRPLLRRDMDESPTRAAASG